MFKKKKKLFIKKKSTLNQSYDTKFVCTPRDFPFHFSFAKAKDELFLV